MKIIQSLTISFLIAQSAFATPDVQIQGTKAYSISPKLIQGISAQQPLKTIRLLNINLTEQAWKKINEHSTHPNHAFKASSHLLPSQIQLGMNNVPVLDQGPYGTCVTFAVTAAIDAALNQGDYISQLCQLELGQYIEQNSYAMSGWNGAFGPNILSQMETFGYVSKTTQENEGCGGLNAYPTDGQIPQVSLTPEEYHQISHNMADDTLEKVHWSVILDSYQAFSKDTDRNKVLEQVKKALNDGDRITFGVLLFLPHYGVMGAVGQHQVENDTWILTPVIRHAIYARGIFGGHEMIITGYDDNAVAVDKMGIKHKGLLTLRNSWGDQIGDAGNFYMSYDYFKLLAMNIERIRHTI